MNWLDQTTWDVVPNGGLVEAEAVFSRDRQYRYALTRRWKPGPMVEFLMLNPSTADAFKLDPTVNKCCTWARQWGAGGVLVRNIFAVRATDPKVMRKHPEPVGSLNDAAILDSKTWPVSYTVCAWGANGEFMGRGKQVFDLLRHGRDLRYLTRTKGGQPGHPLYLNGLVTPLCLDWVGRP